MEWPDGTPEAVRESMAAGRLCKSIRRSRADISPSREQELRVFTEYCSVGEAVYAPLKCAIQCMKPRLAAEMLKCADKTFVVKKGGPLVETLVCSVWNNNHARNDSRAIDDDYAIDDLVIDDDYVRLFGALLRAGVDPNEVLDSYLDSEWGGSLAAHILMMGPGADRLRTAR